MRYSQEVKNQAAELYAQGLSTYEIGKRLDIPRSTIYVWVTPKGQQQRRRRGEGEAHKEYMKKYNKAYAHVTENRERRKELERERGHMPEVKERKREWQKKYSQTPKAKRSEKERRQKPAYREWRKRYHKERYATNSAYRTRILLSTRINKSLRGFSKSVRTEELLGISVFELTRRWDTEYGPAWRENQDLHIDHIRPCTSFDPTDPGQQRLCFNWRNLQLIPATENMSKGNLWTPEMESAWVARIQGLGWEGELFLVFGPQTSSSHCARRGLC